MPIAYSYVRFSTPEQAAGNSLARQLEAARKYAADNGLTLDETMRDEGLSGYHGKHLSATAHLGNFLKRIERGEIPKGSVLIVEHLDRLGRDDVEDALARFIDIKKYVTIVTLMDGQRYGRGDHWSKLMVAIVSMATANEESAKKAVRTKDNWKRVRGTTSALAPSWIIRDKGEFRLDPEKTAVVRRLCCDLMLRMGYEQAAQVLNREGVPTLNGRRLGRTHAIWDASAIAAIVRNRKVVGDQEIGTYDGGKRKKTGEFVSRAYPGAITEAEWYAMQQAIDGRKKGTGRMDGRKTARVSNLFGDLARCAACGNRMTVMTRGRGSHLYLACSVGRLRGNQVCNANKYHRLDRIERLVTSIFAGRALEQHEPSPHDPLSERRDDLAALIAQTDRLEAEYEQSFLNYGAKPEGHPAHKILDKMEAQIAENKAAIKRLEHEIMSRSALAPLAERLDEMHALVDQMYTLPEPDRIAIRVRIAAALPSLIESISIAPLGDFRVRAGATNFRLAQGEAQNTLGWMKDDDEDGFDVLDRHLDDAIALG